MQRMNWCPYCLMVVFSLILSCTHKPQDPGSQTAGKGGVKSETRRLASEYSPNDRGELGNYDPGAPKDSRWVELFGSAPNYRMLGQVILGGKDEKFRWMFGPMWYRGRLGKDQVKVFVVGQEGAQDENISNRAFTGSTGTKTQNFLNHLGIETSYLFMNTFVYTINGQLSDDPKFKWMEQGEGSKSVEDSPIVAYRHKLFDYMMEQNAKSVSLFMGVGSGGKASLATWINARGGKCNQARDLEYCNVEGLIKHFNDRWKSEGKNLRVANTILAIGVPHPGGANPNLGGDSAYKNIVAGFQRAAQRVAAFKEDKPQWLVPDENISSQELKKRLNGKYYYRNAPIPFQDFAFGTNWRMGKDGTSSNRSGADSIQVFSDEGEYSSKCGPYNRSGADEKGDELLREMLAQNTPDQDIAWEPPRWRASGSHLAGDYDYGPCGGSVSEPADLGCSMQKALVDWPDFSKMSKKPKSHPSFGYSGIYRGNLKNPTILILADQQSHDDMFSGRALTGEVGQSLQALLDINGAQGKYLILRTLPVDTLGMDREDILSIALDSRVVSAREQILAQIGNPKLLITLGPVAKAAAASSPALQKVSSKAELALPVANSWDAAGEAIASAVGAAHANFRANMTKPIARGDLPYHTRWWMGSSGNRGARCEDSRLVGNYYRVYSPRWMKRSQAPQLDPSFAKKLTSLVPGGVSQ